MESVFFSSTLDSLISSDLSCTNDQSESDLTIDVKVKKKKSRKIESTGSFISPNPKALCRAIRRKRGESVDVQKILRPDSHSKYLSTPKSDHVVFITTKEGHLVPLSTLCTKANTVMSSNVDLVPIRNESLGRPQIYIRDGQSQRLLAIGGSRRIEEDEKRCTGFSIVNIPSLTLRKRAKCEREAVCSFHMDEEYAKFATEALREPSKGARVDIRELKKMEREKNECNKNDKEGKNSSSNNASIVDTLFKKVVLDATEEENTDLSNENEASIKEHITNSQPISSQTVSSEVLESTSSQDHQSDQGSDDKPKAADGEKNGQNTDESVIANAWNSNCTVPIVNPSEIENRAIVTEEFERKRVELRKQVLAGLDKCDVEDCFCKERAGQRDEQHNRDDLLEANNSKEDRSVVSGSSKEPIGTATRSKVATSKDGRKEEHERLKKVKRALKNLGVTVLQLDDDDCQGSNEVRDLIDGSGLNNQSVESESFNACSKDFCRLGCICGSLKGVTSTAILKHCGKPKCMFYCSCSEGNSNSNRSLTSNDPLPNNCRLALSHSGEDGRERSLAAHEKRFANTVVMSGGGKSFLMLNNEADGKGNVGGNGVGNMSGSGHQRVRRERKLPSRYQEPSDSTNSRRGSREEVAKGASNSVKESDLIENSINNRVTTRSLRSQAEESLGSSYTDTDGNAKGTSNRGPHPYLSTSSSRSKKLLESKLASGTIRPCTVLVPRLELNSDDISIWCMFHWQYNCPCFKMNDPEDFAPDRSVVVMRRRLKRKQLSTTVDPDQWSDEFGEKYAHDLSHDCARTHGYIIKPSNRTQMPHTIVMAKKKKPRLHINEDVQQQTMKVKPNEELESSSRVDLDTQISKVKKRKSTVEGSVPSTSTALPFDLSFSSKGKSQKVPFGDLRKAVGDRRAIVYVSERNRTSVHTNNTFNRLVVFVSKPNLPPYITQAKDIKTLDPKALSALPILLQALASSTDDFGACTDDRSAVILVFNGIAWEVTGAKQQNNNEMSNVNTNDNEPTNKSERPFLISAESRVQKLPRGKNYVAMERSRKNSDDDSHADQSVDNRHRYMRIRLPATTPSQHWCTLRVSSSDPSLKQTVQCPDSSLALKCDVLQQAVNVASKEKTTVRIPIPVHSEVSTFGVYAVPSLHTHVFVGPFTNKSEEEVRCEKKREQEVICLEDSDEEEETLPPNEHSDTNRDNVSTIRKDNDEERGMKTMTTGTTVNNRRKQVLQTRSETELDASRPLPKTSTSVEGGARDVATFILTSLVSTAVSESEKKSLRGQERRRVVGGQVPHVVQKGDQESEVIVVIDSDKKEAEANELRESITANNVTPNYLTLPPSKHGKVVVVNDNDEGKNDFETLTLVVGRFQTTAKVRSNGEVMMTHPTLTNHSVMCSSIEEARCFLEELSNHSGNHYSLTNGSAKKGALKIKSTEELCGDKPMRTSTRTTESSHLARVFGHISSFNSSSSLTTKDYFDLMSSSSLWRRTVNRMEILCLARDEILALLEEQKNLEELKRGLMIRRKKLFCQFTQLLRESDFSPEQKKQRLVALKAFIQQSKGSKTNDDASNDQKDGQDDKGDDEKPVFVRQQEQHVTHKASTAQGESTSKEGDIASTPSILEENRSSGPQQFLPVQVQPLSSVSISDDPRGVTNAIPRATTLMIPTHASQTEEQIGNVGTSGTLAASGSSNTETPYSDVTGLCTVKKDGKILRPMNAFMLWAKEYRKRLIAQGFDGATVSKILAEKWKHLGEDEKAKFHQEADRLKSLHQLQHPDYKFSPKSKRPKDRGQSRGDPEKKGVVEIVLD